MAGEVTSKASVDVEPVLKQLCAKVGYTMEELSTDGELALEVRLNRQSPDIAQAVVDGEDLGAGDQGIMVGYATDETPERMPLPVVLAQSICRGLDESRIPWLKPDGKAQVTVRVSGRCAGGREHSGGLRAARRGCAGGDHPQGSQRAHPQGHSRRSTCGRARGCSSIHPGGSCWAALRRTPA